MGIERGREGKGEEARDDRRSSKGRGGRGEAIWEEERQWGKGEGSEGRGEGSEGRGEAVRGEEKQ